MARPKSPDQDKFIIRLPDGMREVIANAAKESGRSMNAEVVWRLKRSFSSEVDRIYASMQIQIAEYEIRLHEIEQTLQSEDASAREKESLRATAGVLRRLIAKLQEGVDLLEASKNKTPGG